MMHALMFWSAVIMFALLWLTLAGLAWLTWRLVRRLEGDEQGSWTQGL
jgi:hypothetical protein